MYIYVTLFSVGKNSEALIIDSFGDDVGELVVWESKEQYFSARQDEPEVIDGGIFAYGLAAGTSHFPDAIYGDRIVSFFAPSSLVELLRVLNSLVHAMRSADWPNWPEPK